MKKVKCGIIDWMKINSYCQDIDYIHLEILSNSTILSERNSLKILFFEI